jgi:hypothetical protein
VPAASLEVGRLRCFHPIRQITAGQYQRGLCVLGASPSAVFRLPTKVQPTMGRIPAYDRIAFA